MLIQESDISHLLSEWEERLSGKGYSEEYRCALAECVYDLRQLIHDSQSYQDEVNDFLAHLPSREVEDYLMGLEADEELSKIESHELSA